MIYETEFKVYIYTKGQNSMHNDSKNSPGFYLFLTYEKLNGLLALNQSGKIYMLYELKAYNAVKHINEVFSN